MKYLEWKEIHENHFSLDTGNVYAHCWYRLTNCRGRRWWVASVRVLFQLEPECGPRRRSLAKAQEDAARMVEEKLIDLSIGVKLELKNYGIDP